MEQDDQNLKCYLKCFMTKHGILDKNAEVDVQKALRHLPRSMQDSTKKLFNKCKSIRECFLRNFLPSFSFSPYTYLSLQNNYPSIQKMKILARKPTNWLNVTWNFIPRYINFFIAQLRFSPQLSTSHMSHSRVTGFADRPFPLKLLAEREWQPQGKRSSISKKRRRIPFSRNYTCDKK